jgi:hypothetical protein
MAWNRGETLKEACIPTSTKALAVVALLVTLGDPAGALTLSTPYLTNGGIQNTFVCTVVSTKSKPIPGVRFELLRANGTTIVSVYPVALLPDDPRTIFWQTGAEPGAYCRVTGKFSKNKTHITLCNSLGPDNPCQAVVTVP